MLYPLLLVCGAVLLFVYVREKIKAYSVKAVLLKSVVSVLFIMVGVYGAWLSALKGSASPLCPFVVLGPCYVACWVISGWISNMYSLKKMRLSHTLAFAYSVSGTSCISSECC